MIAWGRSRTVIHKFIHHHCQWTRTVFHLYSETESRLRIVFTEAYAKSLCIIVWDEVDTLCPKHEDGLGREVEKHMIATLLILMDDVQDDSADTA